MAGNSLSQDSKGGKRKWIPTEDATLISCMVDMYNAGHYNADTGFRSGYLPELEKMLEKKMPGCGLKARPHIESRLRTLKKDWSIVYDLIYGPHTSGFGWDASRKMVTAEHEVWDAFLKSHKDAAQFRVRSFPHFEELTIVWGKDRATGKDAQAAEDILEEMELEDMDNQKQNLEENLNSIAGEESNEVNNEEHSHAHQPSESTSLGRKRKRSGYDVNIIVDAVKELVKEFKNASEKLANTLASTDSIQEKFVEVTGALRDIDGLTREERVRATRKFSKNPNDVLMFFGAKPEERLEWVKDFLAYN